MSVTHYWLAVALFCFYAEGSSWTTCCNKYGDYYECGNCRQITFNLSPRSENVVTVKLISPRTINVNVSEGTIGILYVATAWQLKHICSSGILKVGFKGISKKCHLGIERNMFILPGILCFVLTAHKVSGNLECMVCNEALDVQDCITKTVICGTGEQCFLEKITRASDGKTVYNGGCRSEAVCRAAELLGKRSLPEKRDTLQCVKCCNTAPDTIFPCNSRLCGASPSYIYKCLDCTLKASASACLTRTYCHETQVCGNEIVVVLGSMIRYNYYCEERHLCLTAYQSIAAKGGKRMKKRQYGHSNMGSVICNACCIGDECNKDDCYTLQHNFTYTDFLPPSSG